MTTYYTGHALYFTQSTSGPLLEIPRSSSAHSYLGAAGVVRHCRQGARADTGAAAR